MIATAIPEIRPPPPHRHDHHVDFRNLLHDLEPDRSLARHDVQIVERVDHHQPLRRFQPLRLDGRLVEDVPMKHDARAEPLGVAHLDERRVLGHDDGGRDAEALRVAGDRLCVIARARRHHAASARIVADLEKLVEGTALLERAGALKVLEFHVQPTRDHVAERERQGARSLDESARDAHPGRANAGEGEPRLVHGREALPPRPRLRCRYRTFQLPSVRTKTQLSTADRGMLSTDTDAW